MKINKWLFILIVILIPMAFILGQASQSLRYAVPLANCFPATPPFEQGEEIALSDPMNKMFRNYYGFSYEFTHHIIPSDISLAEYYETFNKGGFHYLKTGDGALVACGFYK